MRDHLIPVQMIERRDDGSTNLVYEGRWSALPRPGEPVSIANREDWKVIEVRHIVDYSGEHQMAEVTVEPDATVR
jgi:hypothetical protein